ncbi:hypothetical protein CYMTET_38007 [Cymbomonas tetramitiformis]|uniref:Uncharacterized protein n=1 Tax=Cymbomonas tetramitiformis TaxID=36881 RepID=A0AAE0CEC0_9CHLO|nr:hypothetical protein CYMTET_38007 [Cymbomonas tetramitiformis]
MCTIATIFSIVGLIGVATDADTLISVNWANSEVTNVRTNGFPTDESIHFYCGLNNLVIEVEDNGVQDTTSKSWSAADCEEGKSCEAFDDCKETATATVLTAVMNVVTKIPSLVTLIKRMPRTGDNNCGKFMSIFTGFLGIISLSVALGDFHVYCYKSLLDEDSFDIIHTNDDGVSVNLTGDPEYQLGPGFICMCLALVFDVPALIVNILVPCPPPAVNPDEAFEGL